MSRFHGAFVSTCLACTASFALAGDVGNAQLGSDQLEPAAALLSAYPGSAVITEARKTMFYGAPMTAADTAQEAADAFIAMHAGAFGLNALDLEQLWATPVEYGKFTAFAYRQTMNGLPVERSVGRILVNNDIGHAVVLATMVTGLAPDGGLPAVSISDAQAIAVAQSDPRYTHLPEWSGAQLVAYAGERLDRVATPAWKFTGDNHVLAQRERYTFFVDATNGQILDARNEVILDNVVGTVQGMGSPGLKPDEAINPPTALNIPELRMTVTGGSNAFSDRNGAFNITNAGTTGVTVTTNASSGRWVNVNPQQGTEISASFSMTPGVSQTVNINPSTSAFITSQVNALIATDAVHNYYRDRGMTSAIDIVIPCAVNIASTCNAYYSGSTINFYALGGGCNNTAYSTVIAHEYGHFVVEMLGLAQGSFGEGFGDTGGMLSYDTAIEGDDFLTSGGDVRQPVADNIQYPCSSEIHTCGEVLAGAFYSTRTNMTATYGSAAALTKAQQLHVSWSLVTTGGSGNDAATPSTAIEVLTVNDDNGNLGDGTPDYSSICPAFALHNISCPALTLMQFQYPDGVPTTLVPGVVKTFRVNAVGVNGGVPVSGSGQIVYSVGGGAWTTVGMYEVTPNNYIAWLPAVTCPTSVSFYVKGRVNTSINVSDPTSAPAAYYTASSGTPSTLFSDNFTIDKGWSYGVAGDTATTGIWNRMVSQSTWGTQPAGGRTSASDLCAVTNGTAGSSIGANDVDTGYTTLLSPVFNLAGTDGKIGYWRWFSNDQGSNPGTMSFTVDVTNNGSTWVNVETVGPTGTEAHAGWFYHEFQVSSKVSPTATVRVRFRATDTIGSIVEAAIDDVTVTTYSCTPACPNTGCEGYDLTGDCTVDLSDVAIILGNYGATGANLPGDTQSPFGILDLADLSNFLTHYGNNCN